MLIAYKIDVKFILNFNIMFNVISHVSLNFQEICLKIFLVKNEKNVEKNLIKKIMLF